MDEFPLCTDRECWCGATVENSTYVKVPYSVMEDIVENGFVNVQSLDFIYKAFELEI